MSEVEDKFAVGTRCNIHNTLKIYPNPIKYLSFFSYQADEKIRIINVLNTSEI